MLKKTLRVIIIGLLFSINLYGEDKMIEPIKKEKKEKSIVEKILAILGVSVTSGGVKGDSDMDEGELWIVDVLGKNPRKITKDNNFKTPIFHGTNDEVFALSDGYLVQFKKSYGLEKPIKLFSVPNVLKLIDSNLSNNELLIIDKNSTIGILSLDSHDIKPYLYDKTLDKNRELLNYLKGWSREYSDMSLFVSQSSKKTSYGDKEWSDISIRKDTGKFENISKCDTLNCTQPSISKDKHSIVFIKESDE